MNRQILFLFLILSGCFAFAASESEITPVKPSAKTAEKTASSDFKSEVRLLKNRKTDEVISSPLDSDEGWSASELSKEPGLEEYSVTVFRDKLWKHIRFQQAGDEFTNIKRFPGDQRAPLVVKNYWHDGPAKIVETDGKLQFFQSGNSKAINLTARLNEPSENPRWVVMAESKDALVGRRLDAYGEGSLYYFSKKNRSQGRHLYLAYRMPIDPKMRFELRLDEAEIKAFDLKTGKALASGKFSTAITRRSTAISHDGEQLIAYSGSEFFVVKLHGGKKIDVGPPRIFLEEGLPRNIAGIAFTNEGEPVVLSASGVIRIYKKID